MKGFAQIKIILDYDPVSIVHTWLDEEQGAAIISEYAHKMLTGPKRKYGKVNQKKLRRQVQAQPVDQEHGVDTQQE